MPKVRQTAALLAPPSSAATTAASFSGSIATGRPPRRPRRRAAASPACTLSWINARSNCASAPKIWNRSSPCGQVVSICSVSERKATPRSLSPVTVARRCGRERPSRSSFQTTRQSPARTKASALARPARSPRLPLAWSSNRCRSSMPATRRASRCRSSTCRSPSDETRMYPTSMCGKPRPRSFRTMLHSAWVCRALSRLPNPALRGGPWTRRESDDSRQTTPCRHAPPQRRNPLIPQPRGPNAFHVCPPMRIRRPVRYLGPGRRPDAERQHPDRRWSPWEESLER